MIVIYRINDNFYSTNYYFDIIYDIIIIILRKILITKKINNILLVLTNIEIVFITFLISAFLLIFFFL